MDYFYSGDSWIGLLVRNETGQSLLSYYGYQVSGLFQNAAEVDNAPYQTSAEPGFFRFDDLNDNSEIGPGFWH